MMLTIAKTARLLGVSARTITRLIIRNELRAFRVGRIWRVDSTDLEAFIADQKRKQTEPILQPLN